jgi:two-component system, NarL family, invasion response regulator UvrY
MHIIVCDDHPVVRQGLTSIMRASIEHGTVREAGDAHALLELVRQGPADVVLLDLGLPGRSGLDVLRQLKQERPRLPVLVLSVHPADQYALRTLRAGAAGYLTKSMADEELVKAVRVVVAGHRYVTAEVADRLADARARPSDRPSHDALSDREFEILGLVGSGKNIRQIADQLCLSYSTVSTYRARLRTKLGLRTDAQIIHYALRSGLVE